MVSFSSKFTLLALLCVERCAAWTNNRLNLAAPRLAVYDKDSVREKVVLRASENDDEESRGIDVSDLGLTMEDLEAPLPPGLLQGIALQGVESTSRIEDVQDEACLWTEHADRLEATLAIPGLRGQPAACLAVTYSTTTATISAFGRSVWSCVLKGEIVPMFSTFVAEDGIDMVPVVQMTVAKDDTTARWGGFIDIIGEDSIL